jgi:hypothetical protein
MTQVYKYAEYLGVNLQQYPELYPLMESGLKAPLPAGWEIVQEGNAHYFRQQRHRPAAEGPSGR